MKLIFDCTELSYYKEKSGHRAGVFYVALNLFKELKKMGVDITFHCDFRRYYFMKEIAEFCDIPLLEENSLLNKFIGYILYKTDKFPLKIKYALIVMARIYDKYFYLTNQKNKKQLADFDVYFSPFSPPSKEISEANLKRFRMIHDVIPILESGHSNNPKDWHNKIYNTINDNDFYFTNSNHTREDVLKYFPFIKESHIKTTLLAANEKFFAEDEGRNWQSKAETEFLKNVSDNQEILNKGTKAYIPLVAGNGNTLGVIEAERSDGFNTDDLARNFSKGGTFAENIKLGLEKEYQHQGRITDELTLMLNRQGLN